MSSLSSLSRGTGQVVRKTQEKLEVHFDPEDHLFWKSPETHCHVSRLLDNRQILQGYLGLHLPKTYSTRTGALILYSEELAKPSRKQKGHRRSQQRLRNRSRMLHIELHTLQDLVRAILAYGGHKQLQKDKKGTAWQPYLHFISDPDIQNSRQMRPGYSAKRYLLKLFQTWDPSILQKLQCAGYIRDPFLLEENSPDRSKKQDLSAPPPKYNLRIFCSPCPYLRTELEQQTNPPGLSPSSHKQSENEAWLVEACEEEKHARRRARIPLRISVRKLSFHLRPQQTKETTWRQDAANKGIEEDTWLGVHQDSETTKLDQGHHEIPKQSVDHPALENTSLNPSELWCEKSHVTCYGGFFPGRKISYSTSAVNQKHLKNPNGTERGPSAEETALFPPIQPGMSTEQAGVRREHRRQMPEVLKLPQISEDSLRAQRRKPKSSELAKELLVLPLLVRLNREPQAKAKRPAGACCSEPLSKVAVCDKLLAPSLNDLSSEPEQRNQQHHLSNSGIPEPPQDHFYLPPLNNKELLGLHGKKTRKKEECAENDTKYQRDDDLFIHDAILACGLLPTIDPKNNPESQSTGADFKTSTSINAGKRSTYKGLPEGVTHDALAEEQKECSNGTSLNNLIMGPETEIIYPSLLGSVQTTDDVGHLEFIPDEEENGEVSLERRIPVSINPPETPSVAQELDGKETRKTQVEKMQGNKNGPESEQSTVGHESQSAEFKQENQQSQDGLCGNSHLLQWKLKKGISRFPQTQIAKWEDDNDSKQGKQLNNLSQSEMLSHMELRNAHSKINTSDMKRASDPESGSSLMESPSQNEGKKANTQTGMLSSENQSGAQEEEETTLPEKASKQAKAPSLNRVNDADLHQNAEARDISENKPTTKQKKHELTKTGAESKAQKRRPKKDKRPNQAEFVVGKPKQKKVVGKGVTFPTEKPAVPTEEIDQEEGQWEVDAEVETTSHEEGVEELEGTSDQSHLPSSPLKEEDPLPFEEDQPFTEEVDYPAETYANPVNETLSSATHPIVSAADASQTDSFWSNEIPEVVPESKGEEKMSREKIIAQRAEQRRLAVERKRREQEELKRKQQEQQERMERMKEEMEQEQQRRMEEMRLRKQQLKEEQQHQEEEAARKLHVEKAAQERLQQQQEEHRRKLLEMQKKKQEEERERAEAEKRRQKEREMWLEEEQRRLAEMAEEERLEYEKRKQEEEEKARRVAEERRKKEEEEARLALEEARKQAVLLARQRLELEEKQRFQYKLLVESVGLERGQDISRPWVYSYFQHPFLKVGDDD